MSLARPVTRGATLVVCLQFVLLGFASAGEDAPKSGGAGAAPPKPGDSFRVPYQLTDTKHLLVRVKFNGKGPFNFIVDTGAPALFVSTDAAKQAGITAEKSGWGAVEKMEIEGGITLRDVKARVEDPFQLKGMNSMNLAGHRLDGMMGYSILANFKMELDLSKSHMVWTKLDWTPPDPVAIGDGGQAPPEIAAMGALTGLLRFFVKERPDPIHVQRGFLGVELAEEKDAVVVKSVVPASPAAAARLQSGDQISRFQGQSVKTLADLHKLVAKHADQKSLKLGIERGGESIEVEVETRKGL